MSVSIDQRIYNTARADGMPELLSLFIVAQAKHETGNYTSNFFNRYNNAFGYSFVDGAKWQLPDPGSIADNGLPIAAYKSLENSVHEITDWIKRRVSKNQWPADLKLIRTPEQYAELLKAIGYFGAPLAVYAAGLRRWFESLGDISKETGSVLLIAAAVILLMRYGKI